MKLYFLLLLSILINVVLTIENNLEKLENNVNADVIPDIDLRNFDVRERFYNCYNPGYDADLIVK